MNRTAWWVACVVALVACGDGGKNDCAALSCEHGQCVASSGGARCLCDDGFITHGNECIPADPCALISCAALTGSQCQRTDAGPSCVCEPGRIAQGGVCTQQNLCMPNPCTSEHQSACEVHSGQAVCRCDVGYAPEGSGCSVSPVFDCASQHTVGDTAEPDECPMLAPAIPFQASLDRTLEPAGDHDWFTVHVSRGDVVALTAGALTMPLLLEVFDASGTRVIASDTRGVLDPSTAFLATTDGVAFVRVRGLRASDTGAYRLAAALIGPDDYANDGPTAQHLMTGPLPLAGSIQYPGDIDAVWYALNAGEAYRFTATDAGSTAVLVELQRIDGGSATISDLGTGLTVAEREEVLVVAHGRNAQSLGAFSVAIESLGPDDYSDTPQLGPVIALDARVGGRLERDGDVDGLRLRVTAGRIYTASLIIPSAPTSVRVTVSDGTTLLSQSDIWSSGNGFTARRDGLVFITVDRQYDDSAAIDWALLVRDVGTDDFPNEAPGAPITLGQAQSARIDLGNDVDVFRFTAAGQRVVRIEVASGVVGAQFAITAFDSQGNTLASGTPPVQFLTAPAVAFDVAVSSGNSMRGALDYTLTAIDTGPDDFTAAGAAAPALTLGTGQAGALQYQGDTDAFAFDAVANHVYAITAGDQQLDNSLRFEVLAPDGELSLATSSGGRPSFLARVSGRHVITVGSAYSWASVPQAYVLNVTDLGIEDHGATTATATPLTVGTAITGSILFTSDVDAFTFGATAGGIYSLTVAPAAFSIEVLDPSGQNLSLFAYGGPPSFRAAQSGIYTVRLSNPYAQTAGYALTVSREAADDFGDTNAAATPLALATTVGGRIQFANDIDVFALTVQANHFYEASCTSTQSCSLEVKDASGALIGSGVYSQNTVGFIVAGAATVYLHVSGYGSVDYTVHAVDLGADDHGDTRATASTLSANGSPVDGVISLQRDVDSFTIAVTAGQILHLGCQPSGGSSSLCRMQLRNPNDVLVAESTNSDGLGVRVAQSGTWLLQVSGTGYSSTNAFSYEVTADVIIDDHGDTNATATVLPLGNLLAGSIEYGGDIDVFAFTVTTTNAIDFRFTGSSSFQLQVRNATGSIVTNVTTYGTWTPPSTGTWYLWVSSPGASPGSYTLQIQ